MAEIRTPPRRLIDLKPRWVNHAAYEGRTGLTSYLGNTKGAIVFRCPCLDPACAEAIYAFSNPVSGDPWPHARHTWERFGDTFESLILSPSLWDQGHWHGWLGGNDRRSPGMLISV